MSVLPRAGLTSGLGALQAGTHSDAAEECKHTGREQNWRPYRVSGTMSETPSGTDAAFSVAAARVADQEFVNSPAVLKISLSEFNLGGLLGSSVAGRGDRYLLEPRRPNPGRDDVGDGLPGSQRGTTRSERLLIGDMRGGRFDGRPCRIVELILEAPSSAREVVDAGAGSRLPT